MCISDEVTYESCDFRVVHQYTFTSIVAVYLQVQTGFGRLGSHYWGFETQDAVPDIGML